MMTRLGIYNFDEPVGHLSGGQRKRLALVAVLLTPCDVLLLDEPTNHLDAEMAEWLENYLKNYRGAMVMVTHDRYFLDSVCNRIVEVDKGQIYSYETNYSGYLAAKQEREDIAWAGERKRQSILRKEIEWMQRGQGRVPPNRKHISSAMRPCGIKKSRMLIKRSKSVRCPPVWEKQPWNYHISQNIWRSCTDF